MSYQLFKEYFQLQKKKTELAMTVAERNKKLDMARAGLHAGNLDHTNELKEMDRVHEQFHLLDLHLSEWEQHSKDNDLQVSVFFKENGQLNHKLYVSYDQTDYLVTYDPEKESVSHQVSAGVS
jgi:predicted  nucleic acid-binding Zn-ribbon protein